MSTENQVFNGIKFYKRSDNLYWYSTTRVKGKRVYMHKYVWEYYNYPIPKGHEIHHIDLNRDNNDINNLKLLSTKEHKQIHNEINKKNEEIIKKWRGNLELAKIKAKEWHKSEAGKEWHRKHAIDMGFGKLDYGERECMVCGKKYNAKRKCQKYCCNNCRATALRQRKRLGV